MRSLASSLRDRMELPASPPNDARHRGQRSQAVFAYGRRATWAFWTWRRMPSRAGVLRRLLSRRGPLDAYLYTDRSLYQPGETAFLSGLLRDADAVAVQGRVLTLKIQRPDGFEVDRRQVADARGGSYAFGLDIPRPASTGQWSVTAHLEPDGEPIGRADFVVEDPVPPRLNVGLSSDRETLEPDGVAACGSMAATVRRAPPRSCRAK